MIKSKSNISTLYTTAKLLRTFLKCKGTEHRIRQGKLVPIQKLMHIAHTPCSCLILVVLEHCIHMVFCFTVVCLYSQYYSHASFMYTTLAKFPVSLSALLSIHKFKDGTNKAHNPCDCILVTDNVCTFKHIIIE